MADKEIEIGNELIRLMDEGIKQSPEYKKGISKGKQEMFDCFLKKLLKDFYGKHFIITEETLKEIKKRHGLN